jgi:glycosidase
MQKIIMGCFWIGLLIPFITPVHGAAQSPRMVARADGIPWWNDRVFYEIFVRSFSDSDGDGNGDLKGIIKKLDYLNDGDPNTKTDLGITGIWLMPIMQSPSYHGYDVADYKQVEQDYGSNDDFKQLVAEAHKRGIAIVIDMLLNHTSVENAWFQDAQQPGSPHDSWYIWQDKQPIYKGPWGQDVWYQAGSRYYYAIFDKRMPDLNYQNSAVTSAMYDVADFWLRDMGVDGFRLDAAKYLIEPNPLQQENSVETQDWLKAWQKYLVSVKPDVMTVGELWSPSYQIAPYVNKKAVNLAFDFDFAQGMLMSVRSGLNTAIIAQQKNVIGLYPAGQYAVFLTNHDQDRTFYEVGRSMDKAKLAAALLLTSTGVPFIYYGEEIGMMGKKPDECIRTPMQWRVLTPVAAFMQGKDCTTNADKANVASETNAPDSLLSYYRDLIHLRNTHPALRTGDWRLVISDSKNVYSFIRSTPDETLLVVMNLSVNSADGYTLSLDKSSLRAQPSMKILFGEGQFSPLAISANGGFSAYAPLQELPPLSTFIFKIG